MVLLVAVVLMGLMSCTHGTETKNATLTKDEEKKCWGSTAVTYLVIDNNEGTILNNTNNGDYCEPSKLKKRPSITSPYQADAYYSYLLICFEKGHAPCSQTEHTRFHAMNVVNNVIDEAYIRILYTIPIENAICVFVSGKQASKFPLSNTNQNAQEEDIPQMFEKYEITPYGATYFNTYKPESTPPASCPPTASQDPKCSCTPPLKKVLTKLGLGCLGKR